MMRLSKNKLSSAGFTLVELLVVMSIVSFLAVIVMASVKSAREKAKIAKAVTQIRDVKVLFALYVNDTGQFPPSCIPDEGPANDPINCNKNNDPFLTNPGIQGWRGPYGTLWNVKHPWGGHVSYKYTGITDHGICLNDDRPVNEDGSGGGYSDNGGQIPHDILIAIDKIIDDGDLSTGSAKDNGIVGEICINVGI